MNIHNIISYVHNFDLSDKFQVVFEAHGSSFLFFIAFFMIERYKIGLDYVYFNQLILDQMIIYQYHTDDGLACVLRCQDENLKPYRVKLGSSGKSYTIEVRLHYTVAVLIV